MCRASLRGNRAVPETVISEPFLRSKWSVPNRVSCCRHEVRVRGAFLGRDFKIEIVFRCHPANSAFCRFTIGPAMARGGQAKVEAVAEVEVVCSRPIDTDEPILIS